MSNKTMKPFMLVTGAMLLGGLAVSQSAFAVQNLSSGYQVSTPDGHKAPEGKCGEGKCGADKMKMADGKMNTADGKGGMMMMADANKDGVITKAEHTAHANAMFINMDTNKDGKISGFEMKAHHDGKSGGAKAKMEGKCGEGKCGADKTMAPVKK